MKKLIILSLLLLSSIASAQFLNPPFNLIGGGSKGSGSGPGEAQLLGTVISDSTPLTLAGNDPTHGATFTGNSSGSTVLTASSVTGTINLNDPVAGAACIPAWTSSTAATYIPSFGTGTGGAGTYNTNLSTTCTAASLFSGWSKTAITPVANVSIAPDGTTTAATVTETAVGGTHGGYQPTSQNHENVLGSYQAVLWGKPGIRTRGVVAFLNNNNTGGDYAACDFSGGLTSPIGFFGAGWNTGNYTVTNTLHSTPGGNFYECVLTAQIPVALPGISASYGTDNGSGSAAVSNSFTGNASGVALTLWGMGLSPPYSIADDDTRTWWSSQNANGAYVGYALNSPASITRIRFAPRPGEVWTANSQNSALYDYEFRAEGAQIQVSSDPTFATDLTTIDTIPNTKSPNFSVPFYPRFQLNERFITGAPAKQYVRWLSPNGTYGNISKLQLIGNYSACTTNNCRPITPTISPWGGEFPSGNPTVKLASSTHASTTKLLYTTDGSNPACPSTGTTYSGPFSLILSSSAVTLNVVACDSNLSTQSSTISTAIFNPWGYKPNVDWYDDRGILQQNHSGKFVADATNTTCYLTGQMNNMQQIGPSTPDVRSVPAISLYSTPCNDLYQLHFVGNILPQLSNGQWPIASKLAYNAANKYWVVWAQGYNYADAAGTETLNIGVSSGPNINDPATTWSWVVQAAHPVPGSSFQNFDLFQDDDGITEYVIAAVPNGTTKIWKLASDYKGVTGSPVIGPGLEGFAFFKRMGCYMVIADNTANYYDSTSTYNINYYTNCAATPLLGSWSTATALFSVDPVGTQYNGQPFGVFKIPSKTDCYMYMGDFWLKTNLYGSRRVYLPLTFPTTTSISISEPASWDWNTTCS